MKTLYLLTNSFPYGDWEPYLETEIKYYDNFDEVYIFALQIRKEHLKRKRTVGNNVKVIPIMKASNKTYLLYSFRTLTDINLYKEFARLVKSRRLSVRNFVNMFVYFSRSHYEADLIDKKMKGHVNKESIFYSYRFEYQPYVAMLLKKKWELNSKIVSRAHRYDLYEEEHKGNYIPMREGILSKIDNIYPCSDHGTDYLRKRFPQYKQKVHTRFLGTIDHGEKEYLFNDKCYEIVSCSTVTKVKRLDLLINALSQIKAIPIKWTHYGDGILMDEIKKMAKDKLRDNIQYEFKGNVSNTELMKQYQDKNYYVFVNVSSSEGIPVSIMEATSFGIPCIATDAGGTKEIIRDKENGVLLSQNITANELTKKITDFCKLDSYQYKKNRNDARYFWNKKFNADYNYQKFINEISNGGKKMFLSVIVPCYNVEKEILQRCILSVLNQEYMNYEILLIDDGSEESFRSEIRDIARLDERIKVITQSNLGVSAARNEGIKHSKGKYLTFVDADDVLVPYFFSEAVHLCEKENVDFLIGGNTLLDNEEFNEEKQKQIPINYRIISDIEKESFKCNSVGELKYFGNMKGYYGRGPWTRLIKREIAENTLFNTELKMGEDIVWNLQLLDKCKKTMLVERIWYLYYVNNNSANHKYNSKMLYNIEKELPCIRKQINFESEPMKSAFSIHILDELKKIYDCYIGNTQCDLSRKEKKIIKKKLYSEKPWIFAGNRENRKYMSNRNKMKSILYQYRIYFGIIHIKQICELYKRKGK